MTESSAGKPDDGLKSSPLFKLTATALTVAQWVSPQWRLRKRFPLLRDRNELLPAEINCIDFTRQRMRVIDSYILVCFGCQIVAYIAAVAAPRSLGLGLLLSLWAVLRIIEIGRTALNTTLFDQLRNRPDNKVASLARLVINALANYVELVFAFAVLYAAWPGLIVSTTRQLTWFDPLFFSALTQLTVSFGDPLPASAGRVLCTIQAAAGLLFVVLIFGRVVAVQGRIDEILKPEATKAP